MTSRFKITVLIFLLIFVKANAQKMALLAHYPLKVNAKEKSGKGQDLEVLNIDFKDGAAYTAGVYDDFSAGKGNLIMCNNLESLDYEKFSVRVRFKVADFKTMPVIVVGKNCRLLSFYLLQSGKIALRANNSEILKDTQTPYQVNQWHQAMIVYRNKMVTLLLDNVKVVQVPLTFSQECTTQWQNKDVSTTDFSNGNSFEGWMSDLQIFSGDENTENSNQVQVNDNGNNTANSGSNPTPDNTSPLKTAIGDLRKLSFDAKGTPSDAVKTQYLHRRQFFSLKNNKNELEVIWQDILNKKIYLTRFNTSLTSTQTLSLSSDPNTILLAATSDDSGNYYYITFRANEDQVTNDVITLYKANNQGVLVKKQVQSSAREGLNIFRIYEYAGILNYKNGRLFLMMGRIMNKSEDGLNHQGGIGVAFDPQTLMVVKNFGQTSGHSFDNFLSINQAGDFIGIDLGDNYPRGIHFHRFEKENSFSKVIYTFKTQHGTSAGGYDGSKAYPLYPEISSPARKYYKWSNDNETYTELGGIVEVNDGYCVIFAGEPDPNGKSLNSSRIGEDNKDCRNLGFIKIRKDFETIPSPGWNIVPKDVVLSKGISERGGFYTFGGNWTEQGNEGVTWLTRYKNIETDNVKYIKTALLPNGNILVLFGKDKKQSWGDSNTYKSFMMVISPDGAIVSPATELNNDLKLDRRDEILVIGNRVFIIQGNETAKKLELFVLDVK
jgi:hypothetical protein